MAWRETKAATPEGKFYGVKEGHEPIKMSDAKPAEGYCGLAGKQ
jgi:hypothetical protein